MTKTVRLYESRVLLSSQSPSPDAEEMCRAMAAYLKEKLRIADFGIEYHLFTEDAFAGKPHKFPRPGVVMKEAWSTGLPADVEIVMTARKSAEDFATGWISAKHSIGSPDQKAYLPRPRIW